MVYIHFALSAESRLSFKIQDYLEHMHCKLGFQDVHRDVLSDFPFGDGRFDHLTNYFY